MQSLRKKLKMTRFEHDQTIELSQAEKEKEKLLEKLIQRNNEVVELQKQIQNHVFPITIPACFDSSDPLDQLTKVILDLKISEDELKRTHNSVIETKDHLNIK